MDYFPLSFDSVFKILRCKVPVQSIYEVEMQRNNNTEFDDCMAATKEMLYAKSIWPLSSV